MRTLNLGIVSTMIPYQNLYIYEISGASADSKDSFKEDFIGCWNEGEASFLFFSQPHDKEVESYIGKKGLPLGPEIPWTTRAGRPVKN